MTEQDYAFVVKLLQERTAIVLDPGKEYLVESRLAPVALLHGLSTATEFIQKLRSPGGTACIADLIEAMVTTETSFFRDVHPFETLRKTVLPELLRTRLPVRELNIWCGASASGQEPYTIAILIREHFPELLGWTVNILASDLSMEMLKRSQEARYTQLEVSRGMPATLLAKYFRQDGFHWVLRDDIRSMVRFQQINLAQAWPQMPMWDIILIRNAMIYFDIEMKKAILRRVSKVLRQDGLLILGGAETTLNLDPAYQRVEHLKSGFYRLVDKPLPLRVTQSE